jgi:hypothetical protein
LCILEGDISNNEAVDGGDLDLSQSLSLMGAVLTSRRHSESILYDIFSRSRCSGVRMGPFVSDVGLLTRACALHGLETRKSHQVKELRNLFLQHLLHGECMPLDTYLKNGDRPACHELMLWRRSV